MYDLRITKLAEHDLDGIVKYIAEELANPTAAKVLLDKLETSYQFLANNPQMYPVCYDEHLKKKGYRKVLINNYLLIFKVDEIANRVDLLRFFYGAQDYIKEL